MIRAYQKTGYYKRAVDTDEVSIHAWRGVGANYDAAFETYRRNRDVLMNVVAVNSFLSAERQSRTIAAPQRQT
jgi:hypothetical protein